MEKNTSNFRIYAKKLFLTYSQVNPKITAEHVLEQLKEKLHLHEVNYVIGKESHQDGGVHYHAILAHFEKFHIRKSDQLDIEYENQVFHGNYSAVRSLRQAVSYICKDKNYITNLENLFDGRLLTAKEFIVKEVKDKGVEQALMDYYAKTPDKAIAGLSVGALKKHFNDIEKLKTTLRLDNIETPFGLDSFRAQPELQQWMKSPKKTLVLVGDSGLGKTQFCKSFVKQNNLKTLIVSHKEDFKRLNDTYDAIIIDDANIHELEETQLLSVIDNQADKTIRVLYDAVIKKAGIIQLITMNKNEFRKLSYTFGQERFARRLLVHQPEKPFIVVNIQNNIVNNINNINIHPDDFKAHQEDELRHIVDTQKLITDISTGRV